MAAIEMMLVGRPCYLALVLLLISAVLPLSFPQGLGRNIKIMGRLETGTSPPGQHFLLEENVGEGRETAEEFGFATSAAAATATATTMDYSEPGANTNPRGATGSLFDSSPPGRPKH